MHTTRCHSVASCLLLISTTHPIPTSDLFHPTPSSLLAPPRPKIFPLPPTRARNFPPLPHSPLAFQKSHVILIPSAAHQAPPRVSCVPRSALLVEIGTQRRSFRPEHSINASPCPRRPRKSHARRRPVQAGTVGVNGGKAVSRFKFWCSIASLVAWPSWVVLALSPVSQPRATPANRGREQQASTQVDASQLHPHGETKGSAARELNRSAVAPARQPRARSRTSRPKRPSAASPRRT